jgi:hypothetical protein
MSYTDYSGNPPMGAAADPYSGRNGIVQALMAVKNPPPGAAVPGPAPQFAGAMPPQPAAPGMPGGVPGTAPGMPGGGAGITPPVGTPGPMPGGLPGTSPGVGGLYGQTPQPTQQPVTGRPAY